MKVDVKMWEGRVWEIFCENLKCFMLYVIMYRKEGIFSKKK